MNAHSKADVIGRHPCFSKEAHNRFGRVHLPVAPACNIKCRYCERKYDCANESRPGVTSRVFTPEDALQRVRTLVDRNESLSVIGIAGPGDPLANEATFEVLEAVHGEFPELVLCVSTNGLYLPERVYDLVRAGVSSLTVTINAVSFETAERIYSWVRYDGRRYEGEEAAKLLLINQWAGLRAAIHERLLVKVNSVFIQGVNEAELPEIARLAGDRGADLMNILPLIPQADFAHLRRPSHDDIRRMRAECGKYIQQMTHCRQCRADAFGTLGEDRDMELEVLHARIGEDYCEMVV